MHENLPTDTPWGPPQTIRVLADGILFIATESHGGIWLDSRMNEQIPVELKELTFQQRGFQGWYEQDCDALKVIEFFHLTLDDP